MVCALLFSFHEIEILTIIQSINIVYQCRIIFILNLCVFLAAMFTNNHTQIEIAVT